MDLSFRDISAGAMAAAVSLGTAATAIGGGAAGAVATAAGQMGTLAASTATAVGANVAHVGAGAVAGATSQMHSQLALVEKPISAAAKGIQRSSMLTRTAAVLSRALPLVAIGASTLSGVGVMQEQGTSALYTSRQGRSAVLGAVGGSLLLVPTPVTQVAAAVTLGALAANEFGGMDRIGHTTGAPKPPPVPTATG